MHANGYECARIGAAECKYEQMCSTACDCVQLRGRGSGLIRGSELTQGSSSESEATSKVMWRCWGEEGCGAVGRGRGWGRGVEGEGEVRGMRARGECAWE
jgi:hypothetical protein